MRDLVIALGGAVAGALATFLLDVRKARSERASAVQDAERGRRRARSTLATALLHDMRHFEGLLRQIYASSNPTTFALPSATVFYKHLYPEMRLLAPESIRPVADFFQGVEHVIGAYDALRAAGGGRITSTPKRVYEFRVHAAFALQKLPDAINALEAEGGIRPASVRWPTVTMPTLPTIPPNQLSDEQHDAPELPD